ncbi:RNA polymerase D (apicoplast) [Plasmodium vinckei lentum]|uniref:DNA-directed RNA polymerase n=1 Tax=Plasmodium vinckei lentum TaxID=138297 RepID=A0A6V7T502_PLAVN|nr:RNA polymerase D [Plasmodium vinckei lentum]
MYFYFFNQYNLKILEKKLLSIFKYNISSKLLQELLYLGFEYSFIYNYSLNTNDFSNFIYLLILYKNKIHNIYNNKYYEIKYNYINIFLNNYYYLKIFNNIQTILNYNIYFKINPIYSNLFLFFNNKIKIKYSQLQQLVGYKGYVSNINGIIYEKPIINNYINELNLYEYILSCFGSKKGIIDTALKTADSGYLTKRLVNITNNFIIKEINCKSPFMFRYKCNMDVYGNIFYPLNLLKFKILQNNIINLDKGIYINFKNIYLTKYILNKLLNLYYVNYINLYIKSVYLCNIFNNICNNCLNYKQLYKYNLGQHIGVISSEAIRLESINIIFENKNIKNNISFISNNIYVIYYVKYYNYLNNILYIYNVCNINKINYFKYKLNFYSYIFEDISSILYSGYSLNTDFYLINTNLKYYFKYLLSNINIYQSIKSSYIYIYNILLESIVKQYSYQNIYLPSIYFELIIKKMLSCIRIISNNFNLFKYNDIIPLYLINIINYSLNLNKYKIYKYEPIILGVTKSILANSGFLTNISFQNTFKILSSNILTNKIDWLLDIKSKIIMTDLLPVGNGWYRYLTV